MKQITNRKKPTGVLIISAGTANPAKIRAVQGALASLGLEAHVVPNKTDSGVNSQPFSLDETIRGAKNRATSALEKQKSDFGFGMEAGLIKVEKDCWMSVGICAIFDGLKYSIGFTPAFEVPGAMVEWIKTNDSEMGTAFERLYGGEKNIGQKKGAIWLLTQGHFERSMLWQNAVIMALVPWLNKDKYP